jgi:hypothetical protein
MLATAGLPPYTPVLNLKRRLKYRECQWKGCAVVSVRWACSGGSGSTFSTASAPFVSTRRRPRMRSSLIDNFMGLPSSVEEATVPTGIVM